MASIITIHGSLLPSASDVEVVLVDGARGTCEGLSTSATGATAASVLAQLKPRGLRVGPVSNSSVAGDSTLMTVLMVPDAPTALAGPPVYDELWLCLR